jgi:hypothetical protein
MRRSLFGFVFALTLARADVFAQHAHLSPSPSPEPAGTPQAEMPSGPHGMKMGPYAMEREASGTSWQPASSPIDGLHLRKGEWTMMSHGFATLASQRPHRSGAAGCRPAGVDAAGGSAHGVRARRERRQGRAVRARALGYLFDLARASHFAAGVGGLVSFVGLPATLSASYGGRPVSFMVFARARLR